MLETILKVESLNKQFGNFTAVEDLSFSVRGGEIVGLLGANGAGKTTTIHMLLGLTKPTAGTVTIFGENLEESRVSILQRVNFASSYVHLPYNLRVVENLKVFAKIYGVAKPGEKIDELLEMFEIAHLKFKTSGMLSSGEQTRLNLCKALLNDPALLVLDEPTASLDPDLADKVRKILKRVKEENGMTVLTTSHNMLDVAELCDRIIFMHRGVIVAEGSSEEIMTRFGTDSLEDVFIRIARTKEKVIA
ncbi:MAG: ABC transporter ATP-binding protein [Candidatus Obscuribacterales bacterium]|nr:ABC transporter ATP-binding protein [Cyanobacteria bacterium HKST-UBA01]MCB9469360.1 ABC transporter ATP-binding protein [Candidatus Obscuribacterales bacterium]